MARNLLAILVLIFSLNLICQGRPAPKRDPKQDCDKKGLFNKFVKQCSTNSVSRKWVRQAGKAIQKFLTYNITASFTVIYYSERYYLIRRVPTSN